MAHQHYPASAAIFALLLSACGGSTSSGGGTQPSAQVPTPPPPPPAPVTSNFDTPEFRRNYGLDAINAIPAYEAGGTGQGIIVSVIDTGIDRDHSDLIGRIHPASTNVFDPAESVEDEDGHGTLVSGIIAANRNDFASHGVAFNAQILAVRAEDPDSCTEEDSEGCLLSDFDIATGVDHARVNGARVINLSLGGDGASFGLLEAIDRATSAGIIVVVSAGNADEDTTDAERANPSGFAQDLAFSGAGNGLVIITGATDRNNELADFSHQAGTAENAFVVAPGVSIITTFVGGGQASASGTSFAAPHVSGAIALLIELFPNLTSNQLVDLLLSTTVDLGAVGIDAIYGRGLIDLGEALDPQGTTSISVVTSDGTTTTTSNDGSGGQTPGAFGNVLSNITLLNDAVFLDKYERGYKFDLGARFISTPNTPSLLGRLDQDRETAFSGFQFGDAQFQFSGRIANDDERHIHAYLGDVAEGQYQATTPRYQFRTDQSGFEIGLSYGYGLSQNLSPELAEADLYLTQNEGAQSWLTARHEHSITLARAVKNGRFAFGVSLSNRDIDNPALFGATPVDDRRSQNFAGRYDRYFKSAAFSVELGVLRENGQLFGAPTAGALSFGSGALTAYMNLESEFDLNADWLLSAQASFLRTDVKQATASVFSNINTFNSSSFQIKAERRSLFFENDRIGFSVTQPLKVESGSALITVPTGVSYSPGRTDVLFESNAISLAPDGREVDVEIGYSWRMDNGLSLKANMLHQFNAGHIAGQHANAFLLRMARAF